MGGRGPAPKDPGHRRRRNTGSGFDELPAEGYTGDFPPLGRSYRVGRDRRKFLASTQAWYLAWARSPMATRFESTDWLRLHMVAPLLDQFHRGEGNMPALANEIRLCESGLGATVNDRQRMRMHVAPPERPEPDSPPRSNLHRLRAL